MSKKRKVKKLKKAVNRLVRASEKVTKVLKKALPSISALKGGKVVYELVSLASQAAAFGNALENHLNFVNRFPPERTNAKTRQNGPTAKV